MNDIESKEKETIRMLIARNGQLETKIQLLEATIKKLKSKLGQTITEDMAVQIRIKRIGSGMYGGVYEVQRTYPITEIEKDRTLEQKALDWAAFSYRDNLDEVYYHEKYGWVAKLVSTQIKTTEEKDKLMAAYIQHTGCSYDDAVKIDFNNR